MARNLKALGDEIWKTRVEKINAELFIFTYGSIVVQLIKDYEDYAEVNKQLEKMGYNIGIRLIDDFLARSSISKCSDFKDTGELLSKVGFKMFLNITPTIANMSADNKEFSLILEDNPLNEYVELPDDAIKGGLWYSNILCGVIRGALDMVRLIVECEFVRCQLRGDDATEIRVRLVKRVDEEVPISDE